MTFTSAVMGGPSRTPAGVRLPIGLAFTAQSPEGPWVRSTPRESDCSATAAVSALAREVIVPVPERLRRDLVWQDSSTVTTCRDSIPLEVTSVRRYRVVGATAVGADVELRVERETISRLHGVGRQLGEPVTITGSGRGTMRFTLARSDGFIVGGEGEQSLELRLDGRRRTQEVRQITRIRIERP